MQLQKEKKEREKNKKIVNSWQCKSAAHNHPKGQKGIRQAKQTNSQKLTEMVNKYHKTVASVSKDKEEQKLPARKFYKQSLVRSK